MQKKTKCEVLLSKSSKRMEAPKIALALALIVGFFIGVFTCLTSMTFFTDKLPASSNKEHFPDPAQYLISGISLQIPAAGNLDAGRGLDSVFRTKDIPSPSAEAGRRVKNITADLEREKKTETSRQKDAGEVVQLKISPAQKNQTAESKQADEGTVQPKPACDLSDPRTDVCDLEGDVRVHGRSSSVVLVSARREGRGSWLIKPYARKFDGGAMKNIRQVAVRSTSSADGVPRCSFNHSVPAVVFTLGGYTGNYYHDFTDILVPLFITSHQFAGDVQFLVETKNFWWLSKYEQILKKLSRYDIIFFNDDEEEDQVHCFPRVIVGLHSHKALSIDPARAPNGSSMVDFARLMREAYSLERDIPFTFRPGEERSEEEGGIKEEEKKNKKKPRLLVIPRHGTRRFTNLEEIMGAGEEAGFEVVVAEAKKGSEVWEVARVVNTCDAMMGVHGAGLTNLVFLPAGAVVIQVVPWGRLENISRSCFGYPSEDAGLHYLEYSICEEESSLREMYPRDHAVFTDPKSIHRLGWSKMGKIYLDKQNVKIDVQRFKPLLLKARHLLLSQ